MSSVNPFEAPQASLQTQFPNDVYDETSPFSAAGRFGRAGYLTYIFSTFLVILSILGIAPSVIANLGDNLFFVIGGVMLVVYILISVLSFIFMIRRLHDLNWSGWLSVLMLIPLINLIIIIPCLFFRGTDGPNNFGPPPKPNKAHVVVATVFVTLIIVSGILAAIAIPSYQQYVQKVQEMSQSVQQ